MKTAQKTTNKLPRMTRCPTCQRQSTFTYAGKQRWSERVARAAGLPTTTLNLWQCNYCHTTLTETSLEA